MHISSHSECLVPDSAQMEYEVEYPSVPPVEEDRRIPFSIVFIVGFIISAMTLDRLPELTAYVRYLGMLCVLVYVLSVLLRGMLVTKEILLYWSFTREFFASSVTRWIAR